MKSIIFKFLVACFFCGASVYVYGQTPSSLFSQKSSNREISFHAGSGLSTFSYRLSQGKLSQGFGGNLGVDYTCFVSKHFGVGTGVGMSLHNASVRLDDIQSRIIGLIDEDGDEYELRTSFINYTERQRTVFFRIPVMLHYRTGGRHSFYAQAGGVLHIPVSTRYEANNAAILNEAYYPLYDVSLSSPAFMGLGHFADRNIGDKLSLKPVITGSAEIGVRWRLNNPAWSLYTGAYVDYGLNDALKGGHDREILQQNASLPAEFTTNSVLSSRYAPHSAFADKVSLVAVGLKVRIAVETLSFGKRKQVAEAETEIEEQQQREIAEAQQQAKVEAEQQAKAEAEQQAKAEAQQQAKVEAEQQAKVKAEQQRKAAEAEAHFVAVKQQVEAPTEEYRMNQTELTKNQKTELAEKIALLKEYPELHLICEGHTCDLGSEEVNLRVGKLRAEAAKKYLVEQGIEESRISVVSKGFKEPLVTGTDEESRKKNRRVVVKISE
jgi:outer membrane protein OmpA-like peptidoglycan-associated protein